MNIHIRIPQSVFMEAWDNLTSRHPFAFERVGFLSSSLSALDENNYLVLLKKFHPVPDPHYLEDESVGASISGEAIRAAMECGLRNKVGQIHAHIHDHFGQPTPSVIDAEGLPPLTKALATIVPSQASGFLIFSRDRACAEVQIPGQKGSIEATAITIVGFPIRRLK
ncbi:MAG: hypothetical protein ACP5I4_09590 [Oceanipulchritudo sp.]